MRFIAITVFVAAMSSAFAQLSANELVIETGFTNLRASSQIMLELTGTDQFGPRTNNLLADAFFYSAPVLSNQVPVAKAEIDDYLNGARLHRITGDGTTLWAYDYKRNDYTSFKYGAYSGAQPKNARDSMLEELLRSTEGSSTFLGRLLSEVFGGDVATYRNWLPAAGTTVVTGGASMADPVIPSRTYQSLPGGLDTFVVYSYPSLPRRSCAFHLLLNPQTSSWDLSEIFYSDIQRINGSTWRTLDWKITVYTGVLPSSTNYVFVPPTTARPIANVKGQGG